jgi:hypothetical protein
LLDGGSVKCWGSNYYGQLGDGSSGSTAGRLSPVVVSGLSTAIAISTGTHSCALLDGGSVKCWGSNYSGQLGDGSTSDRSTPVVVSGLSTAIAISTGGNEANEGYSCSLLVGGTVECWGYNGNGELGSPPPLPSAVSNWGVIALSVPSEPSGLSLVSKSQTTVTLSWTAPTDNGSWPIVDYKVEYSSNGGTSWSVFAHTASTATSLTVTGLAGGTGYRFRVSALNAEGTGPASVASDSSLNSFTPVSPSRVFDTRPGQSGIRSVLKQKVGGLTELRVKVTDLSVLVPASGVGAVSLNVTVTQAEGSGFVTVYPCGTKPNASSLNYVAGQTIPNAVIAPVSAQGEV